jgi:hypothetical protein
MKLIQDIVRIAIVSILATFALLTIIWIGSGLLTTTSLVYCAMGLTQVASVVCWIGLVWLAILILACLAWCIGRHRG